MQILKDEICEARDGVELAVNVYLPEDGTAWPVLLNFSPYGKETQEAVFWQPKQTPKESPLWTGSSLWDGGIEAGDIEYITDSGYALVSGDVRGTGDSGGEYGGLFDTDGEDGYDLVEWAAEQDWCNGKVGMTGRSWLGTNQLLVAAERPPSLEGIFASGVFTDLYREWCYFGGILNLFSWRIYNDPIAPHSWFSTMERELDEDELDVLVEERTSDPAFRNHSRLLRVLHYPFINPLTFDVILNDTDNEYYEERSPHAVLDQIDCPVHVSGAWGGVHTIPTYTAYEGIETDQLNVMMTPATKLERPYHEYKEEMIRWFDWLLRDEDTGFSDEPPVKMYVTGREQWRWEEQLIPERTEWEPLYLRNFGRLLPDPDRVDDIPPTGFTQVPPTIDTSMESVEFVSRPMQSATEITGPLSLTFHGEIDATDTTWMGRLVDVAPSGEKLTLSRGYLKASHRAVDEERSEPYRPYHPHDDPRPVEPGEVYEYNVEFQAIAHVFGAGHRLELQLHSLSLPEAQPQLPGENRLLPHAETIAHKIYHDAERPSHLLLPYIGDPDEGQWIDPGSEDDPGPAL